VTTQVSGDDRRHRRAGAERVARRELMEPAPAWRSAGFGMGLALAPVFDVAAGVEDHELGSASAW